jgi:hypothetical protein
LLFYILTFYPYLKCIKSFVIVHKVISRKKFKIEIAL